jgi:hypothetical protein
MVVSRKLLIGSGAFLLGLVAGPILVAAVASLSARSDSFPHNRAAFHLLADFDDRYPAPLLMASRDFGLIARKCGYGDELFSDFSLTEGQKWTPSTGYFDLMMWLEDEFRTETDRRRAEQLGQHFNSYSLAFLDRCLRQTALTPFCGEEVRLVLKEGNLLSRFSLPSPFDQPRRTKTICTYLDGLAARNGQPLAKQPLR